MREFFLPMPGRKLEKPRRMNALWLELVSTRWNQRVISLPVINCVAKTLRKEEQIKSIWFPLVLLCVLSWKPVLTTSYKAKLAMCVYTTHLRRAAILGDLHPHRSRRASFHSSWLEKEEMVTQSGTGWTACNKWKWNHTSMKQKQYLPRRLEYLGNHPFCSLCASSENSDMKLFIRTWSAHPLIQWPPTIRDAPAHPLYNNCGSSFWLWPLWMPQGISLFDSDGVRRHSVRRVVVPITSMIWAWISCAV